MPSSGILSVPREGSLSATAPARPWAGEVSKAEGSFGTDLSAEAAIGGGWVTAGQSVGHTWEWPIVCLTQTNLLVNLSSSRTLKAREATEPGSPGPESRGLVGAGLEVHPAFSLRTPQLPHLESRAGHSHRALALRSKPGAPCRVFLQIAKPPMDQIQLKDASAPSALQSVCQPKATPRGQHQRVIWLLTIANKPGGVGLSAVGRA